MKKSKEKLADTLITGTYIVLQTGLIAAQLLGWISWTWTAVLMPSITVVLAIVAAVIGISAGNDEEE